VIFFVDASSLVKLYREETGTETMRALFGRPDCPGAFFISDHVALEVFIRLNRLKRTSTRRERRGFQKAIDRFELDRSEHLNVLSVDPTTLARSRALALRFDDSGAGTLDFIHLASAHHVTKTLPREPLVFVVSDRKLRHLVSRSGISVFDPECQQVGDLGIPGVL
jgi:predicted nucleic acid-binding protein